MIEGSKRLVQHYIGSTWLKTIISFELLVLEISSIGEIKPMGYIPTIRDISGNFCFISVMIFSSNIVIKERISSATFS